MEEGATVLPPNMAFLITKERISDAAATPKKMFRRIPGGEPDSPPVLNPLTEDDSEWTHHPMLIFGLGFRF